MRRGSAGGTAHYVSAGNMFWRSLLFGWPV